MEESLAPPSHDSSMDDQTVDKLSLPQEKRNADNDEISASGSNEKIQHSADNGRIKLERKETDVSSDSCLGKLENSALDSDQDDLNKVTNNLLSCDRPEIKKEKEEEAPSLLADGQIIDIDPNLSTQNSAASLSEKVNEQSFKCSSCDLEFQLKSLRDNHMCTHCEEEPHKCPVCEKGFKRKDYLALHSLLHKKYNRGNCDDEKRSTQKNGSSSSASSFSCDRVKEELEEKFYQTPHLDMSASETDSPDQSEVTNKRYKCSFCSMAFSFNSLLRNHMVIHSKERPFACPMCTKTFKRKYELIKHKKTHPGLLESETGLSKKNINKKGNESDELANSCSVNNEKINKDHVSHLKEIAEQTLPDYSLKNDGVEDRPFKCSFCNLTFRLKNTLISHIVIHSKERPYKCSICNKGFKRKDNVAQHMKTHDKVKKKMVSNVEKRGRKKKAAPQKSTTSSKIKSVKEKSAAHISHVKKTSKKDACKPSVNCDVGDRPYKCSLCSFAFRSKTHLQRHVLIHSGERPYECSICQKCFKRKDDMVKHKKNHVGDKVLKRSKSSISNSRKARSKAPQDDGGQEMKDCKEPPQGISVTDLDSSNDRLSLLSQAKKEKENDVISLEETSKSIEKNSKELKNESKLYDSEITVKESEIGQDDSLLEYSGCDVVFSQDIDQRIQLQPSSQSKWHVCTICKKSYIRASDLKMHHKKMHESNSSGSQQNLRPHKCCLCGMAFRIKGNLKIHMLKHSDEKPFGCNVCQKAFKRKYDLDKHKEIHSRSHENICTQCGRVFKGKHWLQKHMKFHESENSLQCSVCKKICQNRGQFIAHVKSHKKSPITVCPLCGKSFTSGTNLKQHLRRHKGEKPFKCTICPRSFVSKGEMMRHVNSHTKEKSYMCDVCGSEFTLLSSLRTHTRIHTGVKPFKCTLCPKTFNQSHHLKTHLRSHLGDKPYKCPLCDKAFSDRRTLKNHMLRHPNYVMPVQSTEKVKRVMGEQCGIENSFHGIAEKSDASCPGQEDGFRMANIVAVTEGPELIKTKDMCEISNTDNEYKILNMDNPYKISNTDNPYQISNMYGSYKIPNEEDPCKISNTHNPYKISTVDSPYKISQALEKVNPGMLTDEMAMDEIMRISEGWERNKMHGISKEPDEDNGGNISKGLETNQGDPPNYSGSEDFLKQCGSADQKVDETSKSETNLQTSAQNTSICKSEEIDQFDESEDEGQEVSQADAKAFPSTSYEMTDCKSEDLDSHISKHTDEKHFISSVCKETFKKENDLKIHKSIHSKSSKNEHTCSKCGKIFRGKRWLDNHMKFHENENSLECALCKKVCLTKGQFINHIKGHKKVASNVCSYCGKEFTSGNNLKQHLRRHKGEKPFKCTICPRSFVSKGEMMRHVNSHTKEKSYMCDVCGSEFTLLSSLRTHTRIHTGVKPFKCTLCPKTFIQSHHLKTHLRSHLGDKPYKCTICAKAFSDRRTLKNHLGRHVGTSSTDSVCKDTSVAHEQREVKILHTPHGELLNLNFTHVSCENR